jgi:hypothetical protein
VFLDRVLVAQPPGIIFVIRKNPLRFVFSILEKHFVVHALLNPRHSPFCDTQGDTRHGRDARRASPRRAENKATLDFLALWA